MKEVIETLRSGLSGRAVGRKLGISQSTVSVYVSRAHKLGIDLPGRSNVLDATESRTAAAARVAADIAAGRRCVQCHLLLPCDHG